MTSADDDLLTLHEIADHLSISYAAASHHARNDHFGPRLAERPARYARRAVTDYAQSAGVLDDTGRRTEKSTHRGAGAVPEEPVTGQDGRTRLYIPHIAAMLDVREQTGFPDPDERDGVKPVWWETTIRRWARESGRLDAKGRPVAHANRRPGV
jgi:hypothetical protein